jgi:hypothetical protein
MAKQIPRKPLIAVSSFNGAIYPDGGKTGVFFVEALHRFEVLTTAGFEVDLASETGTCGFDDVSRTPPFLSGSEHAILNNPKHHQMNMKTVKQIIIATPLENWRLQLEMLRIPYEHQPANNAVQKSRFFEMATSKGCRNE